MGHSYLNSQLLTVPVYLTGAVTIIIMARLADKWKMRSPFIVVSFFLQIIGRSFDAWCSIESTHTLLRIHCFGFGRGYGRSIRGLLHRRYRLVQFALTERDRG